MRAFSFLTAHVAAAPLSTSSSGANVQSEAPDLAVGQRQPDQPRPAPNDPQEAHRQFGQPVDVSRYCMGRRSMLFKSSDSVMGHPRSQTAMQCKPVCNTDQGLRCRGHRPRASPGRGPLGIGLVDAPPVARRWFAGQTVCARR